MAFKGFEEYAKKAREEFMSHVDQDIQDLASRGTPVTKEEFENLRINSYEAKFLIPHLTDEAFLWLIEQYFHQVRESTDFSKPCTTYEEFLATDGSRELARRLALKVSVTPK